MWNLSGITRIEYQSEYCYDIVFDDGVQAIVDFSEYLDDSPVFAPLRDLHFFRQAKIEGDTISWPNGADIAPETLYEKCQESATASIKTQRA